MINENERIDNLECNGLKIIQNEKLFCFGIDSILLADFAKEIKEGSKIIDLGTGSGIIGILLCAKTKPSPIIGVEIQSQVAEMAKRSIQLNNLQNQFKIINDDIKNLEKIEQMGTFDAVVTNPPYKKMGTGITNENKNKLISRHEITATLEDFIQIAKKLLKPGGNFYMVHRPDRLVDIIELLRKYKLEPKKIRLVHPNINKAPNIVLIKSTKDAKPFLKIEKPLYVYNEQGEYTNEIQKIYNE